MKKAITLLFLVSLSTAMFAQRSIDWSVEELITPDNLYSNSSTGTAFNVKFVCKNNSVESVVAGDTILWFGVLIDIATNQIMIQAPDQALNGNRYIVIADRTIAQNDTIHIGRALNINTYVTQSRDVRVGVASELLNRSNSIKDDKSDNNEMFADMVWYNPNENGVSVENVDYKNNIAVYPNPANDLVNVKLLLTKFDNVKVELIDLAGKTITSNNVTSFINDRSYKLDVADVENGVYIVKVTNGEKISTSKVTISH